MGQSYRRLDLRGTKRCIVALTGLYVVARGLQVISG
jgi:hypothetical protein